MADRRCLREEEEYFDQSLQRQRVFRDRMNPLDSLSDEELYTKYRFTRNGILFLIDILEPHLKRATKRSCSVDVHLQVLSALYFLASGCFQRITADSRDINLSQATISRVVNSFCLSLCSMKNDFIKFPTTQDKILHNEQHFFRTLKLPNIVGLIDGTQVQIIAPREQEEIYVNHQNYHSINVQVVCDFDCKITNIVAKWPGSVHDSTILKESQLKLYFDTRNPNHKGILLGDSGYGCSNWLLTPYKYPSDATISVRSRVTDKKKQIKYLIFSAQVIHAL